MGVAIFADKGLLHINSVVGNQWSLRYYYANAKQWSWQLQWFIVCYSRVLLSSQLLSRRPTAASTVRTPDVRESELVLRWSENHPIKHPNIFELWFSIANANWCRWVTGWLPVFGMSVTRQGLARVGGPNGNDSTIAKSVLHAHSKNYDTRRCPDTLH